MRYYTLTIVSPQGQVLKTWTSLTALGVNNPNAQNIQFDAIVSPYDTPAGAQTLTVEGVSLEDLQQAQNFVGSNAILTGGMTKGLPLAQPSQAGLLTAGLVYQSFGNWIGTDMTLEFVLVPSEFTVSVPGGFMFSWKAGQTLAQALKATFSAVYPDLSVAINISPNLVLNYDVHHLCKTLSSLARFVKSITSTMNIAPGYQGVSITVQGGLIDVYDGTVSIPAIQLDFPDMIGQPTWIEAATFQVKLVLRGDLRVGSQVKMPKELSTLGGGLGLVTSLAAAFPSRLKYKSTFQGTFLVREMRHVGNFRDPDGSSWVTILNCIPTLPPQAAS